MLRKLAEFFQENYSGIKEKLSIEDCVSMISMFEDSLYYKCIDGEIKCLLVYLKVNDDYFNIIKGGYPVLNEPEFILECLKNKGKNIHFFLAISKKLRYTLEGLRSVIKEERPDTVSWFKYNIDNFRNIKLRGQLCHS